MANYELCLPAMGEGVMEATITSWLVKEGESINEDESVVEIATDKVDSDVPTPVSGTIKEILVKENEIAKVGQPIAIVEVEGEIESPTDTPVKEPEDNAVQEVTEVAQQINTEIEQITTSKIVSSDNQFYSPLVRSIAEKEGISQEELMAIVGTGLEGRVTKTDIQGYLESRNGNTKPANNIQSTIQPKTVEPSKVAVSGNDEIIEMDRMRKLIAKHMVDSVQTAPHVSSFVETDMTKIVLWRNKYKQTFQDREGEKLTFMPMIVEAIAKAIKDFPMINISVDGDKIIRKKDINIGIATARPDGNLIVPVIKRADEYSLAGLTKKINDLAHRARTNQLKPDEVQGGTYTISNIGSFGNILGTPIINQPQVAILAIGTIEKKPSVVETSEGDVIAVRHKMYLSHSYDHRVVDGALGGMFVKRVSDYLEKFDTTQEI